MLTREDVERIISNELRELSMEVEHTTMTDPNSRTIVLRHNGREISRATFDIVEHGQYEG